MITVNSGVNNYGGVPLIGANTLANRPAASIRGRLFVDTTNNLLQYDTGSAWVTIGSSGPSGTGAAGQATFWTATSTISGDNAFFWDNTNKRLGLGTTTPGVRLDIHGTGVLQQLNGTTTNSAFLDFQNAGTSRWRIGNNYNAGTQVFTISNQVTAKNNFVVLPTNRYLINSDTLTATDLLSDFEFHKNSSAAGIGFYLYNWQYSGVRSQSIWFNQTRGGSQNTFSSTLTADVIGSMYFNGSSNSAFVTGAYLDYTQNGSVSTFTPGTLRISSASASVLNGTLLELFGAGGNSKFNNRLNVNNATDNALFELNNNGNFYTGGLSPTILTVNTNTTMARTVTGYYCTATLTLTLPSAASLNNVYWVIAGSGVTVTVNRAGSDDILNLAGASVTSITISPNQRAMFYVGGGTRTFLISQA
jgi:hypothetical protein